MSITICLVCRESAEKAFPVTNFDEFKCPNCGYYSVNRQLIEEMTVAGQVFDTERTQQFLLIHAQSGQVPAITRKHRLILESTRKGWGWLKHRTP